MARLRVRKSVPLPGPFYISGSRKKRKVHRSEDEQMAFMALMFVLVPGCFLAVFFLLEGWGWAAFITWLLSIALAVWASAAVFKSSGVEEE